MAAFLRDSQQVEIDVGGNLTSTSNADEVLRIAPD